MTNCFQRYVQGDRQEKQEIDEKMTEIRRLSLVLITGPISPEYINITLALKLAKSSRNKIVHNLQISDSSINKVTPQNRGTTEDMTTFMAFKRKEMK